jgi:hypothetical protein
MIASLMLLRFSVLTDILGGGKPSASTPRGHGFQIHKTYEDSGKSGLNLDDRDAATSSTSVMREAHNRRTSKR